MRADDAQTLTLSWTVPPPPASGGPRGAAGEGGGGGGGGEAVAAEPGAGEFARYLEHASLDIAVFDATTEMPLGSARVALRPLLRQRRRAVQMLAEYQLLDPLAEPLLIGPVSPPESSRVPDDSRATSATSGATPAYISYTCFLYTHTHTNTHTHTHTHT